jgi:hypothetical protein
LGAFRGQQGGNVPAHTLPTLHAPLLCWLLAELGPYRSAVVRSLFAAFIRLPTKRGEGWIGSLVSELLSGFVWFGQRARTSDN